jgi:hypothetical protein
MHSYFANILLEDKDESYNLEDDVIIVDKKNKAKELKKVIEKYKNIPQILENQIIGQITDINNIYKDPLIKTKTIYLFLDSRYKVDTTDNTVIKWNIAPFGTSYDSETTALTTEKITNIKSIKMYPFVFKSTAAVYQLNRIYVTILELQSQSYTIGNNKKIHYEFFFSNNAQKTIGEATGYRSDTVFTNNQLSNTGYTQPILSDIGNNEAIFYFDNPIDYLDTLTIQFSNLYGILKLDPETLPATLIFSSRITRIIFNTNPFITVYDRIIISNLTVNLSSINTQESLDKHKLYINNLLRPEGWIITNYTTNNNLYYADISLSSMFINYTIFQNIPFNVYFDSKRTTIRLEIECYN